MEKDLTKGSIYKALRDFSIPFLIANLLQAVYGAVDLAVVGAFTDTAGLSAVSIGTQVMQIVNGLILGITMGGTILTGQFYGAGKKEETQKTVEAVLSSGLVFSLIITAMMFIFTNPLLKLLKTPEAAFIDARNYVLVASAGVIFIFGYNAVSAILRGLGDSKHPLYFIGIACVLNVILDLVFVGKIGMRAEGAALATIISQGLSMVLALIFINSGKTEFKFRLRSLRANSEKIKTLVSLGFPISLQEVLLWGSFLVIVAIANFMGVAESAAVGIVAKVETFAMLPPMALSYALTALTAQNMGAKEVERAKTALKASIGFSIAISVIFILWAQIAPETIIKLFQADQPVIEVGSEYLRTFSIDFFAVSFKFNLNGFLNGCGCTTFTMINGIFASVFVRVPLAYLLAITLSCGMTGLGLAAPIASLVSIICSLIFIKTGTWKEKSLETI